RITIRVVRPKDRVIGNPDPDARINERLLLLPRLWIWLRRAPCLWNGRSRYRYTMKLVNGGAHLVQRLAQGLLALALDGNFNERNRAHRQNRHHHQRGD